MISINKQRKIAQPHYQKVLRSERARVILCTLTDPVHSVVWGGSNYVSLQLDNA